MLQRILGLVIVYWGLLPANVFAQQAPAVQWQQRYTGHPWNYINTCTPTADGGYILACSANTPALSTRSPHGGADVFLVKTDAFGNIIWEHAYGGRRNDQVVRVTSAIGGGYIFAGMTQSSDGDVPKGKYHGNGDAWVVKTDDTGMIEWQEVLGGSAFDCANDIMKTTDGGYLMVGSTRSIDGDLARNGGKADIWMVKMDAQGKLLWSKTCGGSGNDIGASAINTTDGGYLIMGTTWSDNGPVTEYHGGGDGWLLKIDAGGNLLWQKTFGGSALDMLAGAADDGNGGFMICGTTRSTSLMHGAAKSADSGDMLLLHVDAAGNELMEQTFGGSGMDHALTINRQPGSTWIISGNTTSKDGDITTNHGGIDAWIIKTDLSGSLLWQQTYGGAGNDSCNFVVPVPDGGLLCSGSSSSATGDAAGNMVTGGWLLKLKSDARATEVSSGLTAVADQIKVYPTITQGKITVVLPADLSQAAIRIVDMKGVGCIFSGPATGTLRNLEIANTKPGDYLLTVFTEKGNISFRLLLVP